MEDGSFIPSIINTPTAFPPTAWSWSRWVHPFKVSVNIPKRQKGRKRDFSALLHGSEGDNVFASLLSPRCPSDCQLICMTGPYTRTPSALFSRYTHYLSALLPPFWNSSLNLGSPQTTHHHYVWLQRGDESRWPCLWFWGSSSCRFRGAASGRAARDCWYWAGRSAPGEIHQKGAVCTVGIDMNNPCFLYHFLSNCVYPITFSVAFSSNSLPLCLY